MFSGKAMSGSLFIRISYQHGLHNYTDQYIPLHIIQNNNSLTSFIILNRSVIDAFREDLKCAIYNYYISITTYIIYG